MQNSYHPLKSIKNCLVNISASSISEKFRGILGWLNQVKSRLASAARKRTCVFGVYTHGKCEDLVMAIPQNKHALIWNLEIMTRMIYDSTNKYVVNPK